MPRKTDIREYFVAQMVKYQRCIWLLWPLPSTFLDTWISTIEQFVVEITK